MNSEDFVSFGSILASFVNGLSTIVRDYREIYSSRNKLGAMDH